MSDLIKAMNPAAPLPNESMARKAAQVSAIGMLIGAANNAAEGWYSVNGGAEAAQRMVESLTGQTQTAEQVQASAQFGLIGVGIVIGLQIILAVVQWLKPNSILPILFLVLVVWALGTSLLGLAMTEQMVAMGATPRPMWLTMVTIVTMAVAAILHIAGIRGGSALKKFREAQAY